ncbi:MAG TPA: archaeosortase/exosortase family protein, partial [Novosphingobium sp.]|nr:archaeosortase/exosortase family protein [Novosphingobium sp.]
MPAQAAGVDWRMALGLWAAAAGALVMLARAEWLAMAGQWLGSSTYEHILLVPAIILWLVAERRPSL